MLCGIINPYLYTTTSSIYPFTITSVVPGSTSVSFTFTYNNTGGTGLVAGDSYFFALRTVAGITMDYGQGAITNPGIINLPASGSTITLSGLPSSTSIYFFK